MPSDKTNTSDHLTDTDLALLEQATQEAWAKAEAVTAGRKPRFGGCAKISLSER